MAKIFETKEDVEREHLKNRVEVERNYATNLSMLGSWGVVVTAIAFAFRNPKETMSKILTWAPGIIGLAATGTAWHAANKAKKAEAKLEKLGPEQIVLPKDAQTGNSVPPVGEGEHVLRLQDSNAAVKQR